MAEAMVTRRLAAILAADIAGYSRLMGEDEAATVRDLKAHQAVVLPLVEQYGGRIIDTAGDGILAEFPSIIHAVECAVQIQTLMAGRNREIPEGRRMMFRIDINVGDVIHDETRIYGDGINIAARLEGFAEPGGICISSKVHEEIGSKLPLGFRDLGFQSLKNIANPVHIYAVDVAAGVAPRVAKDAAKRAVTRGAWLAVAGIAIAIAGGALWLAPGRPRVVSASVGPPLMSIAVMPFSAASAGSNDERFAERLTQDATSALQSSMRFAPVASAGLAAKYKGQPADPRTVGHELNVRYILDGDVRDQGKTIMVTTRLVETSNATQVWNDQVAVPRSAGDEASGEIVAQLTNRVRVGLHEAEKRRVARLPATAASTALELTLRADELWEKEGT